MPRITNLYVELAERIARRLGSPRVHALHLRPPKRSGGGFCALELDGGAIGLAFLGLAGTEAPLRERFGANEPAGAEALAVARGITGNDPVARTLGFAAVNALSQALFSRAGWSPDAGGDLLGAIDPRPGEHIGMVGYFGPLVPVITGGGARLTVLELDPALVREEANLRVTLDPAALAPCVKIVITSSVLLNDTLEDVLPACRNAARLALIGPTAACVPDPLFTHGIDALGGRRVVDRDKFVRAFRSGERWGPYAVKYVIKREAYPGVDQLLAAVH